jgi:hypothetical protein
MPNEVTPDVLSFALDKRIDKRGQVTRTVTTSATESSKYISVEISTNSLISYPRIRDFRIRKLRLVATDADDTGEVPQWASRKYGSAMLPAIGRRCDHSHRAFRRPSAAPTRSRSAASARARASTAGSGRGAEPSRAQPLSPQRAQ